MPDLMLKHCGLSEYYVHYGWCLEFLVSNMIVFILCMSAVWHGAEVICVTILKMESDADYFLCVWEAFFQINVIHYKHDINQRMIKPELKGSRSFMVCLSDCATFVNKESGRSKIFIISSKRSFKYL